ncbi:hypothetical protein JW766_00295 [Candidatus Dojkabacteria bacterium]|nr:hypothetical protein [Candidatus Dojkabacteria bacterium]
MRKPLVVAIAITFFMCLLGLSFRKGASADVGEAPSEGGIIVPGEKTDKVEMIYEKVVYDIQEETKDSPFYQGDFNESDVWVRHYAQVSAEFKMKNTSSKDEVMDLMFPIPANYIDLDYFKPEDKMNPAINFMVYVDNKASDFEYEVYDMYSFMNTPNFPEEKVIAIKFPVTFKANLETNIKVEYDARLVFEPKSIYGTFNYIMETGADWSGSIGSGEIIFSFPSDISSSMFDTYNEGFKIEGNELVWKFSNLEPGPEDNIKVSYAPSLLGIWDQRDESLEDLVSGGDMDVQLDKVKAPAGYDFGFYYMREGNVVNLLRTEKEEEGPSDGWFADLTGPEAPFVLYEFDAVYRVDTLNVTQAISQPVFALDGSSYGSRYDIFSTAKTLKLTFSDGSSITLNLENLPTEEQVLEFEKVETSSVKVEFVGVYPNHAGETDVLGIARMNLDVGGYVRAKEAVEDKDDQVRDTGSTTEDKEEGNFFQKYFVVFTVAVVIVAGTILIVVVLILVKTKKKKTGSEKSASHEGSSLTENRETHPESVGVNMGGTNSTSANEPGSNSTTINT